jgi:hypothetical protein
VNASHRKLSYFRHAAGARQTVDATVCGFPSWKEVSAPCVLPVGSGVTIDAFIETYHQRVDLLVIEGCGISQL